MIFEYAGNKFQGTRAEVIKKLKVYLSNQKLTWSFGHWHLAKEKTSVTYGPCEARIELTDKIVSLVHFEFHGTTFEDIGDLEQHLGELHLIHEGSGSFTLGRYCRHFKKHSVGYIRDRMIKDIINGI